MALGGVSALPALRRRIAVLGRVMCTVLGKRTKKGDIGQIVGIQLDAVA
jgi:hypothetical protein